MEENLNKLLMEEILEATRKLSQERTSIESVLNGQNTVDGSAIEGAEDYQRLLQEKAQYEAEIKKLEGRKEVENGTFVPTRLQTEYEGELNKINEYISKYEQKFQAELADKKEQFDILATEYNQITDAVKVKERIEAEEKEIEPQYTRLLKQKEDCEAELAKLDGRRELRDGTFGPTREQEEYERELAKINSSIAKFATLKDQNRKEFEEQEKLVESLYAKYDIRNKAKAKETEQPAKVEENEAEIRKQEAEMWNNYRKEQEQAERAKEGQIEEAFEKKQEQEEIDDLQATYQAQKEADTYFAERDKKEGEQGQEPQQIVLLQGVNCTIENGKLKYTISYRGADSKIESFEVPDVIPHSMDSQEARELEGIFGDNLRYEYFANVDMNLANILSRSDAVANTDLYEQYIQFVKDMVDGKKALKDDIKVQYDLQNLARATELSREEKRLIKKIAKRNERNIIAEYIKPKSLLTRLREGLKNRLTRKSLPPATGEKTQKDQIFEDLKEYASYPDFDINQYIKQKEAQGKPLSLQDKNMILQEFARITTPVEKDDIRTRVKVDTTTQYRKDSTTYSLPVKEDNVHSQDGKEPGDE